ncbi:MAG TPA: transposase [Paracoccaceae bacterium]|nr:transposase [Paracoccaceae bacterium]
MMKETPRVRRDRVPISRAARATVTIAIGQTTSASTSPACRATLDAFVARASEGLPPGAAVQALMEPTGMSWFPIAHRLADAGIAVTRVKGRRVRALRRYLSEHVKTDLADAQVLAAMPLFGGPGFDPVHIPAPKSHALQRLTKQRARFQDAVAGAKAVCSTSSAGPHRTSRPCCPICAPGFPSRSCGPGSIPPPS